MKRQCAVRSLKRQRAVRGANFWYIVSSPMTIRDPSERCELRQCGICDSTTARVLYTASDRLRNSGEQFAIARCEGCGVLRTAPDLSDDELSSFYPEDYWGASAAPSNSWIRHSQKEKVQFLGSCGLDGGRILDVGCGSGFFLRA